MLVEGLHNIKTHCVGFESKVNTTKTETVISVTDHEPLFEVPRELSNYIQFYRHLKEIKL